MTFMIVLIGHLVALCELGVSQSLGLLNSASHPRNHFLKVEEDLSNYFPPFAYSSHMLELPEWLGTFRPLTIGAEFYIKVASHPHNRFLKKLQGLLY